MIIKNYIFQKIFKDKPSENLSKNLDKVFKEVVEEISSPNKTLNVLSKNFKLNIDFKDFKRFKRFKNIAIIGMGGSILGSEAIYSFLEKKIKKQILFFNDLNIKKILEFKKEESLKKTLIFIISKSGNTVETLSNAFVLSIIKKNSKNVIIVSEKKDNFLFNLSKRKNLFYIEHKSHIGGRYSVLSEVGLVPAYLMGVNIFKLRSKTLSFLKGKNKKILKESTIKLARLLKEKKIKNLIFLNYFPEFEKFLFWCQQLIAESLGKNGKGFLPMISNVPKDHHSLLQLYLDGPKDKLFYIFNFDERTDEQLDINNSVKEKHFLDHKTLSDIKNAQKKALIKVLKIKKIPFREFQLDKISEETISELFSYFILETVIVGKLAKTNPFDQPAVEQVKILTKKLLS